MCAFTGHTACVQTSGSRCGHGRQGTATRAAALAVPPPAAAACRAPAARLAVVWRRPAPGQQRHWPELRPPPSRHLHAQLAAQQQAQHGTPPQARHPRIPSTAPAWRAAGRHQLQGYRLAALRVRASPLMTGQQLPPRRHCPPPCLAAPGAACVQTGTLGRAPQSSGCRSARRQPWPGTCAAPARCRGRSCTACRRGGGRRRRTPPPSEGLAGRGTQRGRRRAATPGTRLPRCHARTRSPGAPACSGQSRPCGCVPHVSPHSLGLRPT